MIKFLLLTLLVACTPDKERKYEQKKKDSFQHKCDGSPIETQSNAVRIYAYESLEDEIGVYKRYRYYKLKNSDSCIKQEVQLSYFEKGLRKRARLDIQCKPQNIVNDEIFLVAANNYYTYRDNRLFLNLDPSTGFYRRIIYGEDDKGNKLHSKEIGCWYIREDLEDELWGNIDYGIQLYLERPKSASSDLSRPNEIYRVTKMDDDWHLTSFDETRDWSYAFCPHLSTQWGFCDLLRNGNIMFDSDISDIQKDQLLAEALLIRTQYNFVKIPREKFEDKWEHSMNYNGEKPQVDFKYKITYSPDAQFYTEQAWIDYIKGDRPYMPDTNIIEQRPVCYTGFKRVVLDDGSSSLIRGEICYIDGEYNFTEY